MQKNINTYVAKYKYLCSKIETIMSKKIITNVEK